MQPAGSGGGDSGGQGPTGLHSVPEDTPWVSASPVPMQHDGAAAAEQGAAAGDLPRQSPGGVRAVPGPLMLGSDDISALVLNQALTAQPAASPALSAKGRGTVLLYEDWESLGAPAKERSDDFGRTQSSSSNEGAGAAALSRQGSGVTGIDRLKRGLQRMMVDRHTLHEFDSVERAPSVPATSSGDEGVDGQGPPPTTTPTRKALNRANSMDGRASQRGDSRGAENASPSDSFKTRRLVKRTLSLDMRKGDGGGDSGGEDGGAPRSRGGTRVSGDMQRARKSISAPRNKLSTFSTVLTREESTVRRDVDAKYFEPGAGAQVPEEGISMKGSVPLHPNSNFRMVWDSIMFVATVWALIVDPISIAFTAEDSGSDFFQISDRIVMVIFFIDIILNFLTGYVDKKDQRIIMHWREVAIQYIKFWLVIDVVSSLPPEAFEGFSENSVVKGARVSKLLRCFKISRLARIVQVLQLNLDIKLSHFMWKIIVWASCCFLWVHWTTCAECFVWRVSDSAFRIIDLPNTPEIRGGEDECLNSAACNARYYLRGLRTAIAFMCGHDQATGSTVAEDTIAVICSLSGSILYSSFIAVCISLLMEMDAERVRYMGQVERLNHYMGRRNVPMALRQRVREYMELTWLNSGGTDDYEVLSFVSRSLRRELAMHNASKLIAEVCVCVFVCVCVRERERERERERAGLQ